MREKREEKGGGRTIKKPASTFSSSLLLPPPPSPSLQSLSLYIHIPFCKKKCDYCDFVSYAGKEELIDLYVENIIKEFHNSAFGIRNSKLDSIYIGGGTPTLLEPKHFKRILENVGTGLVPVRGFRTATRAVPTVEITVEANPGTADKKKLKALKELGVNRLSIGAQSFNDRHLKTLGRIHDSADILRFYDDARAAGFENINVDLIFAIPGQTLDEWKDDLSIAIGLNPNHLSTYNLTIEEHTPLAMRLTHYPAPSPDLEADMFEYTIETLTAAGYRHYEISNFARPGFECLHNINYWKNGNYVGLGAGAHSHMNGQRWANPDSIEEYLRQTKPTNDPRDVTETDTDKRETLFLGLRMTEGLPVGKFQGFEEEVNQLLKEGLLARNNGHYHLTPRGLMLGNQVFSRFV